MKLTQKQTNRLLGILTSLEAARDELANDRTQIFLVSDLQGSKILGRWYSELHNDKEAEGPIQKFVGSNLALLPTAIHKLKEFINGNQPNNYTLIL